MSQYHPLEAFIPEASAKPRKPAEARRTGRVVLLVSPAERERLEALAKDRATSLSMLLRSSIQSIPPTRVHAEMIGAITKVGVNLNQIVRALHSGFPNASELTLALQELRQIQDELLRELKR